MGIQSDAGELLNYLYKIYNEDQSTDANQLVQETGWSGSRLDKALTYLKDLSAIKITLFFGNVDGLQNFNFDKLTPIGINMVEDKPKFKRTFGINVGFFTWQVSEA